MIASPLLYTPYYWNYMHNTHHLTNGNNENKFNFEYNELIFHTFKQYKAMYRITRTICKILFSPYVLFTLLAHIMFLIIQRIYVIKFFIKQFAYIPSYLYLILDQIILEYTAFYIFNISTPYYIIHYSYAINFLNLQ